MLTGTGTRLQAGIPRSTKTSPPLAANGLLLRGVVMATYVSDDPVHPVSDNTKSTPIAVYCDVLVYPSRPGSRWMGLKNVVVSQPVAGMHRGRIWKPRAASVDFGGQELSELSDPSQIDGDHVLVGFLNGSFDQPIVVGSLPHPAIDTGHPDGELGQRMKLTLTDGDPDYFKHHGVYYGVSDDGNWVLDTTWANSGEIDSQGIEPDPPTDARGSINLRLPQDASYDVSLFDMSTPASPNEVCKLSIFKDKLELKITQGASLVVEEDGADATLTLGDGAVAVAVANHLQTLYQSLATNIAAADAHTHTLGAGVTSGPNVPIAPPAWDSNINSNKLLIPDT